ncbi:MAG: PHP domain-containing protein [Propionibacteriaceae bacterium]
MRIDLHTHSAVSDGTDTPTELVAKARAHQLDVIALTDHDTHDGLPEAFAAGVEHGVRVVPGMELSCARHGQSVHLLAYGADPGDTALLDEIARVQRGRSDRLAPVLAKLAELGAPVTEAEVLRHVGGSPSVGRPHIADALVSAGHVRDRAEAFDRFLADGGPAHVPRYAIEVERGIDLVHAAGGVAVLAHPWGRGREAVLGPDYITELAREHHLDGLEVDHQDHGAEARRRLHLLADELGLLATGSSDHHGLGKQDHELGCNTTDPDVLVELESRFRR